MPEPDIDEVLARLFFTDNVAWLVATRFREELELLRIQNRLLKYELAASDVPKWERERRVLAAQIRRP